eukprot:gene37210-48634_t
MPPTTDSTPNDDADSHLQQTTSHCQAPPQPYGTTQQPPPATAHTGQTDPTFYLDDIVTLYHPPQPFHTNNDTRIERLLRRQPHITAPRHILYRAGHPPMPSDDLSDLVDISNDEINRLAREGPNLRPLFPPPGTYDVRVTTYSDDQQTDSDDEPDTATHNPATWYDHTIPNLPFDNRNMTQPLTTPPHSYRQSKSTNGIDHRCAGAHSSSPYQNATKSHTNAAPRQTSE